MLSFDAATDGACPLEFDFVSSGGPLCKSEVSR